jgi:dephospho-CoA kinase
MAYIGKFDFFRFFQFMPWHKSAKKGYFFAFIPGIYRNIFVYVRGLYPGVYGISVLNFNLHFTFPFLVVKPNKLGWRRITKIFGTEILNSDKTIDRDKLGRIVFDDVVKRRQLNKCTHGLIAIEMLKRVMIQLISGARFVVLDVPLLLEVSLAQYVLSYTVVVQCADESERRRRLLARNPSLSEGEARQRMQAHMKSSEQTELADFVIDNSQDVDNTRRQVKSLVQTFRSTRKYLLIRLGLIALSGLLLSGAYLLLKYIFN